MHLQMGVEHLQEHMGNTMGQAGCCAFLRKCFISRSLFSCYKRHKTMPASRVSAGILILFIPATRDPYLIRAAPVLQ